MIFEIYDDNGLIINRISASTDFVEQNYRGRYKVINENSKHTGPYIITKIAMLTRRLTTAEFVSILMAAKTDVEVEAWKYLFDTATTFDLDSQTTKDGIALLVAKGLLTQERADEILNAPIQPEDRP